MGFERIRVWEAIKEEEEAAMNFFFFLCCCREFWSFGDIECFFCMRWG